MNVVVLAEPFARLLPLVLAVATLASCRSDGSERAMTPDTPHAEHHFFPEAGPPPWEQSGKIDRIVRASMERWSVPGVAVAVGEGGRLVWAAAYGVREAGANEPLRVETLLQAASVSKAVTAAAALSLVAEGRIELDSPIAGMLPDWPLTVPAHEGITLRRLLSHTSGLGIHGFPGYRSGEALPDLPEILRGGAPANHGPVVLERLPGEAFAYSGGGYMLVQHVLSQVTGRTFEDVVRARIFEPAGMSRSLFGGVPEGASIGHRSDGLRVEGGMRVHPELAAAGLWTTAEDLARFALSLQGLDGGRALIELPSGEDAMWRPVAAVPGSAARLMGMGLFLREEGEESWFFHSGANSGFRALLVGVVGRGSVAAILTNGEGGEALAWEVVEAIAAAFEWPR